LELERSGAAAKECWKAKLLKRLVGAWGFEPPDPYRVNAQLLSKSFEINKHEICSVKFALHATASTASAACSAPFCVPICVPVYNTYSLTAAEIFWQTLGSF